MNGPTNQTKSVNQIQVRVADITIALSSCDPELKLEVRGATRGFLVEESEPEVNISVAWREAQNGNGGRKLFDSRSLWQLSSEAGRYCFRFTSPVYGPHPYKLASFDSEFTSGQISLQRDYFDPERPVDPLEHPLHELLVMSLLMRGRGVEVHACGLIDGSGRGHLFVGQSGGGKTTTARLWQKHAGVEILSDDRIILRKLDGRLWMYGTPWHGEAELASPSRSPLTAVYFLRHGRSNELTPLSPVEAVERFVTCGFPPFYNPSGIAFTLEFFEDVARAVPCYLLDFVPDAAAVEFIQQHTQERSQRDE